MKRHNAAFLAGLKGLTTLYLNNNPLGSLTLPNLPDLTFVALTNDHLTSLTLPLDLTNLASLVLTGNPINTFVLPESLADTSLSGLVTLLTQQGAHVYAYPMTLNLGLPTRTPDGVLTFNLTGPPDAYHILGSSDLITWSEVETITNLVGSAVFTDVQTTNASSRFYRGVTRLP